MSFKKIQKQKWLLVLGFSVIVIAAIIGSSKPAKTSYKVIGMLAALNPATTEFKSPSNIKPATIYYQDGDKGTEAEIFRKGSGKQGAIIMSGGVGGGGGGPKQQGPTA